MNTRAGRFPLVDSLRALAAFGILLHHTIHFAPDPLTLERPLWRLEVGVTVFFLISAFLLYRPFVKARVAGDPPPRVGAYAWRRFLRIAPAYWVALTVMAVWVGLREAQSAGGVIVMYGFGRGFAGDDVLTMPQAWSLTVEVCFYAFLPLWAYAMHALCHDGRRDSLRVEIWGLGGLVLVSCAYKAGMIALGEHHEPGPARFALPAYLDHFALGMMLAATSVWIERRGVAPRAVRLVERVPGVAWLVALVAYAAVTLLDSPVRAPETAAEYLAAHWLYAVVALGLLLPAVFGEATVGLVRRLLATRVLLWLGLVSYGIYLYHWAVMIELFDHRPSTTAGYLAWTSAAAAGAVAAAALSYYVVERPALRLKRLVSYRARAPELEAIAEPAPAGPAGMAKPR